MSEKGDHLVRTIAQSADLRVAAVITTDTVKEAVRRHQLSPVAAVAVGRAITAGLLLATNTKGQERVTVQLQGNGPLGSVTVDANSEGHVRAYTRHPEMVLPQAHKGDRVELGRALGRNGVVNVVRDLGLKDLYQGQVPLTTGEVDEDVEAYLHRSEQVPSALGCEVILDEEGNVKAAGGVLIQTLPGGDFETVRPWQHELRQGRLFAMLKKGELSAFALAQRIYHENVLEPVGDTREVKFQCRCTAERIADMLKLLSTVDLDEMIADDKPAEIFCNYCNERYLVQRPELEKLRDQVAGHPRESN